jgi:uncharacterized membrane protein YdjX (TVP38/TMEM64 family)
LTKEPWLSGTRLKVVRVLILLVVIGITVFIFSIRDRAEALAAYGYPGIFLLSLLSNATLILPAPGIALTFAAGAIFNPFWVAIAAGAGATLGELTGYAAGFSGKGAIENSEAYIRLKRLTERYGHWTIFTLALLPNPLFDLAGASAGALGMRVPRFVFWTWIGKTLKMLIFAFAGAKSIEWLSGVFGGNVP